MIKKRIMGASIGNCVHVAGVVHFLNQAEDEGYQSIFLGPAIAVDEIIRSVELHKPDMVGLAYRLTPENGVAVIQELIAKSTSLTHKPIWIFGGTRPVAERVAELGFFDKIFDSSEDLDDCIAFLRNQAREQSDEEFAETLVERMDQKKPYPLLRHHFGLPSYEETVEGVVKIAESRVLDIISLGIDQNTQQFFFRPDEKDPKMAGAGGVPVNSAEEFVQLKAAGKVGNFPLMRCYSGTADVIELAQVLTDSIQNAWCAVPLCWYNELDGRGTRKLEDSMREAQALMRWHGERSIPVEMNEPHHWGLRDAHDTISVVMSHISAYNALRCGVRDYISQYMFNIPNSLTFSMDLAKVLAQIELTESLADDNFRIYRQTRAGLPFLSGDPDIAKGQLAASTSLQMTVNPHIIHVVGYSEGEYAATPEVVIESSRIVRGVIRSTLYGNANAAADPLVERRKKELLSEARFLLNYIVERYESESKDPLADADVLSDCIRCGILDAPHIVKGKGFYGNVKTRVISGMSLAVDPGNNQPIDERTRLNLLNLKDTGSRTSSLTAVGSR